MELRPLEGCDSVWVEESEQVPDTGLPTRFFTAEVMDEEGEQVTFAEHEIEFPITDWSNLAAAISTADQFYSRMENGVVYERRGIEGLVEFLLRKSVGPGSDASLS